MSPCYDLVIHYDIWRHVIVRLIAAPRLQQRTASNRVFPALTRTSPVLIPKRVAASTTVTVPRPQIMVVRGHFINRKDMRYLAARISQSRKRCILRINKKIPAMI
jgi:hypothetical protein